MTRKGVITLVSFILSGVPAMCGDFQRGDNLLTVRLNRETATERLRHGYLTSGAATMHFADSTNISTAALTADIEKFEEPVMMQNGSGHNLFGLEVESSYKLSAASTVWGHAGYQTGTTRDISFSDVIDYETVAPYILGDDTGGNLKRQQYLFGGGWGRLFGAWSAGIQADYKATIAHRAVDPRVRNIVSDLSVEAGGGRRIGANYLAALNCGVRIYQQDTDVDFYNPTVHAITKVFTGIGETASRFSGANAQSSTHKLTGFYGTLQFVPIGKQEGFYATGHVGLTNVDLILDGYNNLKFGTTSTLNFGLNLSQFFRFGQFSFVPTLCGEGARRTGTENLFGSSADNYEKIGERQNYSHDRYGATLSLPLTWQSDRADAAFEVNVKGGYHSDKESLKDPKSKLATDYATGAVAIGATKRFGNRWAAGVNAGYSGKFIATTSAELPGLDRESPEGEMAHHNYEMSACDASAMHIGATLSRALSTMVVSLSAKCVRHEYRHLNKGTDFYASLSLTF